MEEEKNYSHENHEAALKQPLGLVSVQRIDVKMLCIFIGFLLFIPMGACAQKYVTTQAKTVKSKAGTMDRTFFLHAGAETTGFTALSHWDNVVLSERYVYAAGFGKRDCVYSRNNRFSCANTLFTVGTTDEVGNVRIGLGGTWYKRYGTNQDFRVAHLGWYFDMPFYVDLANGFKDVSNNALSLYATMYYSPLRFDFSPGRENFDLYLSVGVGAKGSAFCYSVADITNDILHIPSDAYGYDLLCALEARPGVRMSLFNKHLELKGEVHVFWPYDIFGDKTFAEELQLNGRVSLQLMF